MRIPYQATKYVLLKKGETPESHFASTGTGAELYLHEIKKGETLSRISKQYNVSVDIIMQWNNLQNVHKIRAGQHLALYLDNTVQSGNTVATLKPENIKKANAIQSKITYYKVKNGDSLWAIARKFQVSAGEIRKWNNLKSNLIHPGVRLVVKKV